MVFQQSTILNPHSPVSGAFSGAIASTAAIALGCAIALFFAFSPAGLADGFPGKGNVQDWSAALPYYNLANRYMQKERYQDAIAKYEEAIARYEYDPDFFINLGVAWRKVENFQAAEAAFKKAAELNEKDWMSWSNLANSYLKQDRLEETIKAFERALQCNPPQAEKEAMLKDIADIKKILSVRSGETVPPPSKDAPSAKIITAGKRAFQAKGNSATNQAGNKLQVRKPGPSPAFEKPVGLIKQTAKEASFSVPKKNDDLKDNGWGEVAK